MGKVWQAHDEVLDRDVAVKEILPPPDLADGDVDAFTARTLREARAAGRVAHPGVAAVYDVLQEDGRPWIVMQFVPARSLSSAVPLPPVRVAEIGVQLLEALRAAHAAGVLHRDVKPDNVLLAEDGRAVLTDFGIATTDDEVTVTRTGVLVGTPAFIAPERALGAPATPASDMWSLGVTLYVAVEGRQPFQRDNVLATLAAVIHAEPAPMSRAGPLAPVITGLLQKHPDERMTLDEAESRLMAIAAGLPPESTAPVAVPAAGPVLAATGLDVPAPHPSPEAGGTGRGAALASPTSSTRLAPAHGRLVSAAVGAMVLVALVAAGTAWLTKELTADQPPPMPTIVSSVAPPGTGPVRQATPSGATPTGSAPSAIAPVPTPTPKASKQAGTKQPSGSPQPSRSATGRQSSPASTPGQVEPSGAQGEDGGDGDGADRAEDGQGGKQGKEIKGKKGGKKDRG
ncbi:serine/threonine-protein kinase [Thermoactinospora rubra]|uniref:serine/threonine-protein kinase n=1 Tax=Thermoactinospora rubra TaxID=1088767 RepID=UPI001301C44D